jgi:hypothetical protein
VNDCRDDDDDAIDDDDNDDVGSRVSSTVGGTSALQPGTYDVFISVLLASSDCNGPHNDDNRKSRYRDPHA